MFKKILYLAFLVCLVPCLPRSSSPTSSPPPAPSGCLTAPSVEVYFSPHGGSTRAIIEEISGAKSEILVQASSFTSDRIAKALVEAHKRGIDVEAILDKSQRTGKCSSATFLAHVGIPTYVDDKHAIAHNEIMIIDEETVITGSFNFTKAAEEKNAENLLILHSKELGRVYLDNWQKHKGHSEVYASVSSKPASLIDLLLGKMIESEASLQSQDR